jgi:hypothetical protein
VSQKLYELDLAIVHKPEDWRESNTLQTSTLGQWYPHLQFCISMALTKGKYRSVCSLIRSSSKEGLAPVSGSLALSIAPSIFRSSAAVTFSNDKDTVFRQVDSRQLPLDRDADSEEPCS